MMLTHQQARRFYDEWGARQDSQGYYEDPAIDILITAGAFGEAGQVIEFGCGTGRFAQRLLAQELAAEARYVGLDLSRTMVELTRERLRAFESRATVRLTEGAPTLPFEDGSADRVVSNYVLDLLTDDDISTLIGEAHRVLRPDGLLCLSNLTHGSTLKTRAFSLGWRLVHRLAPARVGGCRPLDVLPWFKSDGWSVVHAETVIAGHVPSQVVVASRQTRPLPSGRC